MVLRTAALEKTNTTHTEQKEAHSITISHDKSYKKRIFKYQTKHSRSSISKLENKMLQIHFLTAVKLNKK